jgi:hypothetical protein
MELHVLFYGLAWASQSKRCSLSEHAVSFHYFTGVGCQASLQCTPMLRFEAFSASADRMVRGHLKLKSIAAAIVDDSP